MSLRRGRRTWFVAACVLALLRTSPLEAQDLHGFVNGALSTSKITSDDPSGSKTTTLESERLSLDLNWNKLVTPLIQYRLTFRGEDQRNSSQTSGSKGTDSSSLLVQPALDLSLATPRYSFNTGFRFRRLTTDSSQQSEALTLSERNLFARFFYTPVALPSLSLQFDRTMTEDDREPRTVDTTTDRYQLSAQHTIGDLGLSYSLARQVTDNRVTEQVQTQDSQQASATYGRTFFRDMLAVQASAATNQSKTVQEFSAPGTATIVRRLTQGFRTTTDAIDPTISPAGVWAPWAISGGPAITVSAPLTAFVVEQFPPQSVAEIEISLAPSPFPRDVRFRLFQASAFDPTQTSTWSEIGVTQRFDSVKSVMTLTFTSVTARFFKVFVDRIAIPAAVTGMSFADTVAVRANTERVTRSSSHNLATGLRFTPWKALSAGYNMTLNFSRQDPQAIETTNGTHAFNVTGIPHRLLTVSGGYQYTFNDSNQAGVPGTHATSASLSFASAPLTTLRSTLSLGRNEAFRGNERQTRSDAATLSTAAKVLPALNVDTTLSASKSRDFDMHRETLGQAFTINANAQVTRRIITLATYTVSRSETTPRPSGATGPAVSTTQAAGIGTTYTLSRFLNASTRFDVSTSAAATSMSSSTRFDWNPTSKIGFAASYLHSSQTTKRAESGTDAATVSVRWQISRYLDINADGSFSRSATGDTVQMTQLFNLTAGFRF